MLSEIWLSSSDVDEQVWKISSLLEGNLILLLSLSLSLFLSFWDLESYA